MIIKRGPNIPEGLVEAMVAEVGKGTNRQTSHGATPTMDTQFEKEDGSKVVQSILVFPGSKLLEQLIAATLQTDDDEIDANDFVGKRCVIDVKHNTVDGTTYANVVGIYPVEMLDEIENQAKEKLLLSK